MKVISAESFAFAEGGPHELPQPMEGYYFLEGRTIYLPFICTEGTGCDGNGLVGKLLASAQDAADEIVVPTVMSGKLMGMLLRRGFALESRLFEEAGEWVECMVWRRP